MFWEIHLIGRRWAKFSEFSQEQGILALKIFDRYSYEIKIYAKSRQPLIHFFT